MKIHFGDKVRIKNGDVGQVMDISEEDNETIYWLLFRGDEEVRDYPENQIIDKVL